MNHSGQPAEAEASSSRSLFHWPPFWFFIFLVLASSAIGFAAFSHHKADTRQEEIEQLSTVADLKAEEIAKWREERKGDAETLAQGPFFTREVEKWLQNGMPPGESRSMILARMESVHRAYGYREIFLFDARGKPVLATSPSAALPGGSVLEKISEVIRTQSIAFTDIGSPGEAGSMGVAAPVLAVHDGKPKAIGAIYLQIDPSRFLFPLLKAIPLTSKSMEIVLVRHDGNDVLFLNVPAAHQGVGLLRQPLSESKLPAVMAVLGSQTEADGVDFRGVPVFAALRKIPGTDWFLVVKVEQEEIYVPLRQLAWLVAGAIAFLIALTGMAVGLWWRNQRASFLISRYQAEAAHQALAQHFDYLTKYANDIILLADDRGRIVEANDRALAAYGYGREALLRLSVEDLRAPESRAEVKVLWGQLAGHGNALLFETMHQCNDKTIFPVEVSARLIKVNGEQFYQEIIRDITERKRAERDILRLNRLYSLLSRTNKMIVRAQNRQTLFEEACRIAVDQGSFRMAWIGAVDETTHFIKPVAMHGNFGDYLKNIRISIDDIPEGRGPTGMALREGRHLVCKDIEHEPYMAPWREAALAMGYRSSAAFPLWAGGTVQGVFTVYAPEANWFNDEEISLLDELTSDISYALDVLEKEKLRKQAEEESRAASLYARSLIEASLDPLVTINAGGKITDVNEATEQVTGLPRQQMIGSDFSEYFTEPEQARAGYREVFAKGLVTDYPLSIRHVSGKVTDVLYNATVYRDEAGNIQGVFAAARDITERKRAEEDLRISEERLALAVRTGGIGIWDWDIVENKLVWDASMYRLYGIRRDDFGGAYEAWAKALHPEDKAHTETEIQAVLRGEREYALEFRVIWPDGSIHYIKASAYTQFDDKGRPLRMVGINYDLTERKRAEQELREKEERLALATIHNGVGVWDWNLVTQQMIWDDSMYSLYHIHREDFIGTEEAWRAALHPDDLERGDREVNDAISGIKPFDTEFRVVWPGGEIRHIKAVAKVFRDDHGTPSRMLGINMDVTELRQTAIALQEKTNLLRNIIDSSADYIFAKDRELRTILCNEIFASTVGKHVRDLIGKTDIENGWDPILVKGDAARGIRGYEQDDRDAAAGKTIRSVEQLTVGGELHYVDTVKLPLRDDAGHTLGMFGISRDITENKLRENIQMARLRLTDYAANHTLKELLVATLDEACALTGSSVGFYHFLDANQKTLSLQAWSTRTTQEFCKAEGEGTHYGIDQAGVWVDCVRERRPVIHNDYAALPHKRGMPPGHAQVEREMVVPIFRNELIVAILGVGNKAAPYKDNDLDSVSQLADLAWDIAVAKRAEEEVRQLNAELEQRVMERTAQLEVANKELESFSYSVSHDLRVPLRAIDGFSRLVLKQYEDKLDDEGKRLLNVVRGNTKRMGQLIDDILAFSRSGRLEIRASEADMEALAREVWQELEPSRAGRDIRLEIKPLPKVQGDPAMLRQVWANLLGNATKFTNSRATAYIEVGGSPGRAANGAGNECTFYVKDNGVGFDQQYAHKLFGVFQRLHGIDEFEGTGIGLAIIKRIIIRHGGRVWAEGKVNEGATIYFTLPIKEN